MSEQHRSKFALSIIALFYLLALYKLFNGMWLFQSAPYFFINRFDGVTWLFMQTGIHQWLLENKAGWILFDVLFYGAPLAWFIIQGRNARAGTIVAACWLIINWMYVQCYTLFPINSIEGHIAWLIIPILFLVQRIQTFYFLMQGLRYFFLFFFASAAIWKFRQGGIFNPQEMSGILLMQHADYLVSAPDSFFAKCIYAIIRRPAFGYTMYIAGTILELTAVVGFFTRKYDLLIFLGFVLFLVMDFFLMRIPYFDVLPIALPLLYSRLEVPGEKAMRVLSQN